MIHTLTKRCCPNPLPRDFQENSPSVNNKASMRSFTSACKPAVKVSKAVLSIRKSDILFHIFQFEFLVENCILYTQDNSKSKMIGTWTRSLRPEVLACSSKASLFSLLPRKSSQHFLIFSSLKPLIITIRFILFLAVLSKKTRTGC